ncbi:MAG: protein kinase [Leptolyngbya sp. SIOISBB]|nr:protein kinase [Leptolyngbya sp. SIOISBB]
MNDTGALQLNFYLITLNQPWVTQDATLGELAKILDFGIAKLMQADSEQTSSFMGTLAYASPEQMEGKELDNRSDIYSLGILMYQMLTGQLPLRATSHTFGGWYKVHHTEPPTPMTQSAPEANIPNLLDNLVMSCLEKQVDKRPQNIVAVLKALEPLEQRYGSGFRMGQRIGATLSRVPIAPKPEREKSPGVPPDALSTTESDICRFTSWPPNKPIAEIVFPHILQSSKGSVSTLWVMMPPEEIVKRLQSTRYNTFICTMSPHPMALWLTVLYNPKHGPRWLPCFLDLKTHSGQEIAFHLGKNGEYKVLYFSTQEPQKCAHVVTCSIADPQQKMLQNWVMSARTHPSVGSANFSKKMLRDELNRNLKEKVLQHLESLYLDTD